MPTRYLRRWRERMAEWRIYKHTRATPKQVKEAMCKLDFRTQQVKLKRRKQRRGE